MIGCGGAEPVGELSDAGTDADLPGETWHDRMIRDACNRCKECCTEVIDEEED